MARPGMDDGARRRIADLVNGRTGALAAVTGSVLVRCGARGALVPERLLAEHARSYADPEHIVVEVMES